MREMLNEGAATIVFVALWALLHHGLDTALDSLDVAVLPAKLRFVASFFVAAGVLTGAYSLWFRFRD